MSGTKQKIVPVYFWDSKIVNETGGFDLVDQLADPIWMDCSGAPAPVRGSFIHHYHVPDGDDGPSAGPFPQNAETTTSFIVIEASTSYQIITVTGEMRHRIDVFVERVLFNWPDLAKLKAQRVQELEG